MIESETKWKSYEEVATYLLEKIADEFDLERIEGKQEIDGLRSSTSWEIDAKGICRNQVGFFLIEFRRHTTRRLSQESIGAIAYRIQDTGARGGIIVSPLGLQEGAEKVATAEGIYSVQLNENSTTTEYILRFLNKVMLSLKPESITTSCTLGDGILEAVEIAASSNYSWLIPKNNE